MKEPASVSLSGLQIDVGAGISYCMLSQEDVTRNIEETKCVAPKTVCIRVEERGKGDCKVWTHKGEDGLVLADGKSLEELLKLILRGTTAKCETCQLLYNREKSVKCVSFGFVDHCSGALLALTIYASDPYYTLAEELVLSLLGSIQNREGD